MECPYIATVLIDNLWLLLMLLSLNNYHLHSILLLNCDISRMTCLLWKKDFGNALWAKQLLCNEFLLCYNEYDVMFPETVETAVKEKVLP